MAEVRYDLIIELGHRCTVRGVSLGRYLHDEEISSTYNIRKIVFINLGEFHLNKIQLLMWAHHNNLKPRQDQQGYDKQQRLHKIEKVAVRLWCDRSVSALMTLVCSVSVALPADYCRSVADMSTMCNVKFSLVRRTCLNFQPLLPWGFSERVTTPHCR